ncbi:MAG: ABC transporter permease subunit/CPBP intramembrane protease [Planctomycetota bacterium]
MSGNQNETPSQVTRAAAKLNQRVPFSFSQQLEFTSKELRETLRDRRTTITLMLMPLLLYPILGFGLRFVAFQTGDTEVSYRLALETETEAMWLSSALRTGDPNLDSPETPDIELLVPNDASQFDLESMVSGSAADLGIRVELSSPSSEGVRSAKVRLYQNKDSELSSQVSTFVERRLAAANIEWMKIAASQKGQQLPIPMEHSIVLIEPADTGSAILGLLPLILLLMTVTGGVYPAIDLTAGERERNTMEALMALPVPPFRLLAAKYVAVVTVTMLTGLMNLLAMGLTLYALQLDVALLGENGFTLMLGIKLFLALSTFALFYSAVLLLLTSSARSFKEAQAYLIPLLLLSIGPGLVVFLPGWSLGNGTAALPLVNILLLAKELLEGKVEQLPAIVTLVSTVLYGVAALSLAARVFGRDAVSVGSRGLWKDLLKRPENTAESVPSLASALTTLALLFPAYFVVSGILSRGESAPSSRLVMAALLTVMLFVAVPWLLLRWQRITTRSGLALVPTGWSYWVGAVLLGFATWPWIFELVIFAQRLGIRGFDPSQIEDVDSLLASWKLVPVWLIVLCLGIAPGVCEECFFRGFLLNGLKENFTAFWAVLFSALAFGVFHVVLAGGAAPERLLPSTLMGLLLGWLAWQSKSVFPSMVLHVIHNSTLLIVAQSRDRLAEWNIGQLEQEHLPGWLLLVSALVLLAGVGLVRFSKQPTQRVLGKE